MVLLLGDAVGREGAGEDECGEVGLPPPRGFSLGQRSGTGDYTNSTTLSPQDTLDASSCDYYRQFKTLCGGSSKLLSTCSTTKALELSFVLPLHPDSIPCFVPVYLFTRGFPTTTTFISFPPYIDVIRPGEDEYELS